MALVQKNTGSRINPRTIVYDDGSSDWPRPGSKEAESNPLAPRGQSVVSDYLGYGSFSGADIKVVVHLPNTNQLAMAEHQKKTQELQQMENDFIASNQRHLDSSSVETNVVDDYLTYSATRDGLQAEVDASSEELKKALAVPTTLVLGEIQTISYSVFREKNPVRTLGSVYPRTYVRGPRTIGGSMVFTVFYRHVLHELLDIHTKYYNTGAGDYDRYQYATNLPDQLPPLDITLLFANEYGAISSMGLYGVEFVQDGGTFSIEDLFSESVVQYVARDLDPIRAVQQYDQNRSGVMEQYKTATNLSNDKMLQTRRNTYI